MRQDTGNAMKDKKKKTLYLMWFNNWLNGKARLEEFVFISGGIAYVLGGFRIELIVFGVGFVIQLHDKLVSNN